jgi:hypothetical protein
MLLVRHRLILPTANWIHATALEFTKLMVCRHGSIERRDSPRVIPIYQR